MIEDADDLASFFDPEEFGEAVHLDGVPGVAIWDRPTGDAVFSNRVTVVDTDSFQLLVSDFPTPTPGQIIAVDRTGECFALYGDPRRSDDGLIWRCPAQPIT